MSSKPAVVTGPDTFETWRLAFNSLLAIACEVVEHATLAPTSSDWDYQVGTKWVKLDTDEGFMLVHTNAVDTGVWIQLGATPGAIINDGTVPLIAPWDAGAHAITAANFISNVALGTAPFAATSTTQCTNLNAALLQGLTAGDFLRVNGGLQLTSDWDVGAFDITNVGGFTSEMITANDVTSTRLDLGGIVAKFGKIAQGYTLGHAVDGESLTVNGGSASGGNIVLWGNSSANPSWIQLKQAGAIKLEWNTTSWNFKTQPIIAISTINGRDYDADGTKLDGIAPSANAYAHPNHTGQVTSAGDGTTTIVDNVVSNAKLTNMAGYTIKLNNTAGVTDPGDVKISGLTEKATPISGDWIMGEETGGALRKYDVGKFASNALPVLQRNPFKNHNGLGTFGAGTATVDAELYPSASMTVTGGTVTIDIDFPAFTPNDRGITSLALSGKIWVNATGSATINVTTDADFNPFGATGNGSKGLSPASGERGCLVWEFYDDGVERFVWCEWISE